MSRHSGGGAGEARSAAMYAALGDKTRLRLVGRLCDHGPGSITELTVESGVSRQAITKHLHVLEAAGLARSRRTGRSTRWELLPERIEEARRGLDRIASQWEAALTRLKAFAERSQDEGP